jgi:large subunit ribosomal protein L25
MYGPKSENVNLQADELETRRIIAQAGGQLIALRVKGTDQVKSVLARELQRDVLTGSLLHADLYEVDVTERIQVDVLVSVVGEPQLVTTGEAMLLTVLNSVEIECLPTDIMQSIEVDVSGLEAISDTLHVRDLVVPSGVEILTDASEMVVRMEAIFEEEEEEEEEGLELPEAAEVEVIQRGRIEEEEEE